MAKTMLEQGGLFNVAQAAISLDLSRERVYELLDLGKLDKFEFLGRIYLSVREVNARRESDVKAGRPARTFTQKLKATLKAAVATDAGQVKLGGSTEYAAKRIVKKNARKKK